MPGGVDYLRIKELQGKLSLFYSCMCVRMDKINVSPLSELLPHVKVCLCNGVHLPDLNLAALTRKLCVDKYGEDDWKNILSLEDAGKPWHLDKCKQFGVLAAFKDPHF